METMEKCGAVALECGSYRAYPIIVQGDGGGNEMDFEARRRIGRWLNYGAPDSHPDTDGSIH
jgi:hypothetical protein